MKTRDEARPASNISRRSFLRLTVGSITLLPTVASVFALPAEAALAEEDDLRAQLVGGTVVYIVNPREVGLVVRDVSVEDGSEDHIAGAFVRITSRANGAVLEGTTDDEGNVRFDITELAEDEGKQLTLPRYGFYGTVEVSAPGYREFRATLIRIDGGTTMAIPTQPREAGIPYPMSTSFDEWDVLYTGGDDATFVSSTGNDGTHDIALSLRDCPGGAGVTAALFCDGARVAEASGTADAAGAAELSFSDTFLKSDSSVALPTGEDHEYTVQYRVGSTTYEVPIKLDVCEAAPDAQTPQLQKDLMLTPFVSDVFKLGFSFPKGWPLIGGDKVRLWEPQFPIWGSFDPFGFIRLRLTSPEFGYAKVYGKPDKSGWQRVPRNSVKKQFQDAWNGMVEQSMDTFDSMTRLNDEGKRDTFRQTKFSSKFTLMVQLEALAMATWDWGGGESRGRAQLGIRAGANYSLTETFWAGPIPVIVRFGIGLNVAAAGMIGFVGEHVWNPLSWRWDYSSVGFDLSICFPPTLSVGVGIAGVASISARGAVSLTFNVHVGPIPEGEGSEGKENPRVRFGYVVGLHVDAEVLFFTYTHKITGADEPDYYDSWAPPKKVEASAEDPTLLLVPEALVAEGEEEGLPLNKLEDGPTDSVNQGKIITESSLEALAEFAIATDGLKAAAVEEMKPYVLVTADDPDTPVAQLFMLEREAETLAAQAEPAPTLLLKPAGGQGVTPGLLGAGEQITRLETQESVLTPVGDHDYVEIPSQAPGVLRLGLEQGFRPTTDIRLAENILASSRMRPFTVGDSDYIARIGVVLVAGNARTRVICEKVGGGDRRVIDFASGYRGDDCFDYDFDIAATTVGGKEVVNLVVISGTRPAGDKTSLVQAANETFFSFVSCSDWFGTRSFAGVTVIGTAVDPFGSDSKFPFRNYSCPRLVQVKGSKDGVEYGQATVAVLVRASRFEDDIMGTDPDLTKAAASFVFFADGDQALDVTSMNQMRRLATEVVDPSIMDIALSGRADGHQLLELKGAESTHYVLLETDPCRYVVGGRAIPWLEGTQLIDLGEYAGRVSRLIPMESGSYFLTCVDGMLKRADIVAGEGTPALTFTDFGGAELNMNDFGVLEGGDVLYWAASRENGGYIYEDDGPRLRDEDGGLNLIMGARVSGGKLSKAFTLCEVGHEISRIRHYGNSNDHMSFISSRTVDLETGKGEQWFTSVPWVRCANLLEAQPFDTLLARGDHLPFYVAIRNDGNCYLSGVELTVAETDGAVIGTMRLDFGEDNMVASEWNPLNEDGTLQDVEDDWTLPPGVTARYLASYVAIPEDWEGAKEIEIRVTAAYGATVLTAEGLVAQAETASIEYLPDQSVTMFLRPPTGLLMSDGSSKAELTRADIRIVDSSKPTPAPVVPGGAKDGGSKGDTNKGTAGKTTTLPKTGDATDTLAKAAALGAVGGLAAFAASAALRSREEDPS